MSKKNLEISCATCDVRNITEELANSYEKICVKAATVISSDWANIILAKAGAELSAASIVTVPENVEFRMVNGLLTLNSSNTFAAPTILVVNGPMEIMGDTGDIFANIVKLMVNGPLLYPESLKGKFPPMSIDGPMESYPADSVPILTRKPLLVDKIFLLRAKSAKYFVRKPVFMLDANLDITPLLEKGVQFCAHKAFVATSLLEQAIPLFQDDTEIVEVPDGCTLVPDDLELTEKIIRKCGEKLIVYGDVTVLEDSSEILEQISYLYVNGDLEIYQDDLEALEKVEHYEDELMVKDEGMLYLENGASYTMTKDFLENSDRPIMLIGYAKVVVQPDIPNELLQKKIGVLEGCAIVVCSKEQESVMQTITKDCAIIKIYGEEEEKSGDEGAEDDNVVRIETAEYVF